MFPIRDKRARVIGFGGRVMDDTQPKYLNSPETPVFKKGHELYGLYEARKKKPAFTAYFNCRRLYGRYCPSRARR